jgi:N-acetylglucosamine-6-sulfatase
MWRVAACLLLLTACGSGEREPARRPNVVLILSDDQRYDTLGCTGNEHVATPNIDRLAREGALFTRAYVVTSLCCPARASLYTGQYAHRTGIRNNNDAGPFLAEQPGFPAALQAAGYETAFIGKWHIDNPGAAPQPGFDHWLSFEGQGQYEDETYTLDGTRKMLRGFNTDVLTEHAIAWLRAPREKPFALVLSVKNLHGPYFPPERHRGALARVSFPVPASFDDPPESLSAFVREARLKLRNKFFTQGGGHEAYVRGYHELVLSLDENVGRLLAALDELGVAQDTLVALTSDGGFLWGEHGMYRKRSSYEPSIRVPLLVRYPREIEPGSHVGALALNVDLAPTFLELAGAPVPGAMQGASLRALWTGTSHAWREQFLYVDAWADDELGPGELAVHDGRYKYVRYRTPLLEERLFDLEADPDERVDQSTAPAQAARVAAMRADVPRLLAALDAPAAWFEPWPPGATEDE